MARVLYVDVDQSISQSVREQLMKTGHSCILEKDGHKVIRAVQEHRAEMLICEVLLQDINGFHICRMVRSHPFYGTLPIVLVSEYPSEDEILHGLDQGADDYVAKPFNTIEFSGRINELLKNSHKALEPNPVTNLPGPKVMKCNIICAISLKMPFALVCAELMNFSHFTEAAGTKAHNIALRYFAGFLELHARTYNSHVFRLAHMGGAHFMIMMEPSVVTPFCSQVLKSWSERMLDLYSLAGCPELLKQSSDGDSKSTLLDIRMYSTSSETLAAQSAQAYFDTLAHLRKKVMSGDNGRYYHDHRRAG